VLSADVASRTCRSINTTWQTLSIVTVEAGGVGGVLNVTFSTDPSVAEGVIRASLHGLALVALANSATLTVVVGNAPGLALTLSHVTVVAGSWVFLGITDPIPVVTVVVGGAAVVHRSTDTTGRVTGVAARAPAVVCALVLITDTVVADLVTQFYTEQQENQTTSPPSHSEMF